MENTTNATRPSERDVANPNSADYLTSYGEPLDEITEAMNEDGALDPTLRDNENLRLLVDPRGEVTDMPDGPNLPGQPPTDNPDLPMPNDPISENPDVFPTDPVPGDPNRPGPDRPDAPNPQNPNELPIDPNRNAPTEPDVPDPVDPPNPGPGDPVPDGPVDPF